MPFAGNKMTGDLMNTLAPQQHNTENTDSGSPQSHVWQALGERLQPLLLAPTEQPDFVAALNDCAADLVRAVSADSDWAIFQLVHPSPEKLARYGVLHALHTGILMCLVGRRKDWHEQRIATAVRAALTMNISITALQTELAHQSEALTEAQRAVINDHPLASVRCLRELGVTDAEWLTAVEQHHEQPNGKGYPQGLHEVSILADALRTCDIFGAKMSERVGRKGMLSPRAAAEIFKQRSAGYYGATIIGVLGLYPPGCLLRLSTGESAVVLRRSTDPKCPYVAVLTDENDAPLSTPFTSMTGTAHGREVLGALADTRLAGTFSVDGFY
jgi:HD-GYP domain-containing protein (c-di-GMP phosphodiesterase class II)